MSQFSWCRSLKPTARWWFSRTDSSLYMRASSESESGRKREAAGEALEQRESVKIEVRMCGYVSPYWY